MWCPRRLDNRGRDEVAAIDLELLFRHNGKSRWGGGYFEINELRASSSTERNREEPGNVTSTETSDVVKPLANFPIVDFREYRIAEKTIHDTKVNHVIEKPKTEKAEAENLKKVDFTFMVALETLIHKTSVVAKLLQ